METLSLIKVSEYIVSTWNSMDIASSENLAIKPLLLSWRWKITRGEYNTCGIYPKFHCYLCYYIRIQS